MKKNSTLVVIGLFVIMTLFLSYRIISKVEQKKKNNDLVQTMPSFKFHSIDGPILRSLDFKKNTLIVFFNSECECCLDLTMRIMSDSIFVANNEVIMVSTENIKKLAHFKKTFKINWQKVYLCRSEYQNFADLFGSNLMYPSIFLFDANKKLMRKGNGGIKLEDLKERNDIKGY
jgi:hypothetical protein